MQEATDYRVSFAHQGQQDATSLLLSDLLSVIQRIQTSIRFNDSAMAVFSLENSDLDGDLFIQDDLTPRYATANAALTASHTILGNASSRLQMVRKLDVSTRTSRLNPRTVQCALVGGLRNA
jgi:hypothetical protein